MSLILACALLLQGETAEETLSKIEDAIQKASSLRVKIRYVVDQKASGTTMHSEGPATLLLQTGNKIRFTISYPTLYGPREYIIVSNGTQGTWKEDGEWKRVTKVPGDYERNLRTALARTGLTGSSGSSPLPWWMTTQFKPFKEASQVKNVKHGPVAKDVRSLIYEVKGYKESKPLTVTLTYDPESYRPLKRRWSFKYDGKSDNGKLEFEPGEGTATEFYEAWQFDVALSEQHFKLPAPE